MPSLAIYAVAALALLVAGFGVGFKIEHNACVAAQVAAVDLALRNYKAEETTAAVASTELETKKADADVVYKTITKTVNRVVLKPIYLHTCFDVDGVRAGNDALAGTAAAPGKPHASVPKAHAP
jgi:hypothetical protein